MCDCWSITKSVHGSHNEPIEATPLIGVDGVVVGISGDATF